MNANITTMTIEMNKTEAKAAGIYNSEKFNELKDLRAAFPGYQIVVKAASKSKDNLKGLTVSYMAKYIKTHDDENGSLMSDFNALRGCKEDGTKDEDGMSLSYGELKKWFLEQYPEVQNMDRTAIILAARKAA